MANDSVFDRYKGSFDKFSDLGKEIVVSCCDDYIESKRKIKEYESYIKRRKISETKASKKAKNEYKKAKERLNECIDFFNSDRCVLYSGGLDGKTIIKHLEERI